ncbi:MAG TPA: SRPBCC family protein [Bacteroidales bacterium]|nr:SRPBCC family protein [Bacteroidales bacterium]HRZ48401.1 SRPBCC family protein [Bacteroidales bacterium]
MTQSPNTTIHRYGAVWQLRSETFIHRPIDQLWPFFSDPRNLEKITPATMRFRILTPLPERAYQGLMISYRVSPMTWFRTSWLTEITAVKEGRYFVDEQRKGPYALWHHEHHFEAFEDGTRCTDIVTYRVPFGIIGRVAHCLFIRKKLLQIFSYREKMLQQLL